ncbi:extracellular solute-binding protein [Paenibacillus hamazuiensis]|uniref:extracellular solute-binding protein n=1 Tax=Paenibacillus hamazuiensis TaxID=2936508 RepID=UPI00200C91F3|nr:extracellular solute-binding protein [Paenibacillus hamazuiensis]
MTRKRLAASLFPLLLAAGASAGCSGEPAAQHAEEPFDISIATYVRPDVVIPPKENEVERAIEAYTHTKLDIQWIPVFAYEEKVGFMIASNKMPKLLKMRMEPSTIAAIRSDLFWEIGPYLPSYKNLAAHAAYFDNIAVEGKIYGVPNFRDMARYAIIYRSDWLNALGLKLPASLEDWYRVMKAMRYGDPDGNGSKDTYGMVLGRDYNAMNTPNTPVLPLLAIGEGGYNEWGIVDGKFVPDFEAKPYFETMKLFRRLYAEDLINKDFSVYDDSRDDFNRLGRSGFISGAALSAKIYQEELAQKFPGAQVDIAPIVGSAGRRVLAEPGNNGFYVIPKKSVPTEAELKQVLAFLDRLMDEPMSTLQLRGMEGKHYVKLPGGKAKTTDLISFQNEVKPYRDNLLNMEGYNVLPLEDTPLGEKARKLVADNIRFAVPNPAYKLFSATYMEMGSKLRTMITEAQTKYIMGQIDDAGWLAEVDRWHKAGGDNMIREYEEAYRKSVK